MPCCSVPALSPLARHAKSVAKLEAASGCSIRFPMYTLPLYELLDMNEIIAHEELKERSMLVKFDKSLGKALFVSHQWIGLRHPDPEFKQLRVLQDALCFAKSKLQRIPVDLVTETMMPSARGLPTSEIFSTPLFIWYDYFSCPQLEFHLRQEKPSQRSNLANAISSIPAYVSESSFFLALCPVVENPDQSRVFTPSSWASRGWCRVERAFRDLCPDESWIMVKSRKNLELVLGPEASVGGGPPGEGQFTVAEDRATLAPIFAEALRRKLRLLLQAQDLATCPAALGCWFRILPN